MQTSDNYSKTDTAQEKWESLRQGIAQLELRTQYRTKPITMHKLFPSQKPMQWPKVIRQAYTAIWSGAFPRVIIKAPRGGGKSKLLGTIAFDDWYLNRRSVVNMGGSFVQAEIVYGYFTDYCGMDASIYSSIERGVQGVTMGETKAVEGHTMSCVTASPKQVRGKHPQTLISDETCETSDELIDSALPMVNDADRPLVIMASTFHKIFGRFAEIWDDAPQRGYLRIQWDIFDVCKTFAPDYWENGTMRDGTKISSLRDIEKLKKYAKGRTGDPDGWIPIENVIQAWREKPSVNWFEVEYLGSRPSTAGLVLKPEDVDKSVFDSDTETRYNFMQGAVDVLGIDWGFSSMTAVVELMGYKDQIVVIQDAKGYHQVSVDEIIAEILEKVKARGIRFIYADSAGKFENVLLQGALNKAGLACKVIEVVFSKEKFGTPGKDGGTGMIGNLRAHFESEKIKMPKKFVDLYYQCKNYRYQEGTDKPVKKDDHYPDAVMCGLQHFILGRFSKPLPTADKPMRKDNGKNITAGLRKKQF